nr:nucleoporin pom34 [Quercus suber]
MSTAISASLQSKSSSNSIAPSSASTPRRALPSRANTTLLPNSGNVKVLSNAGSGTAGSGPSTPQQDASSAVLSSTPGKWQHPRMNEVLQRQSKTRFDNTNMRTILANAIFLIASLILEYALQKTLPRSQLHAMSPYPATAMLLLRLFFLFQIATALAPWFRKQDLCEDVPLTPAQRAMLGLPPMSRPATPSEKEQYVTPPRYSRSGTPRSSGSSSLRAQVSGSPLSGRGTPMKPGTSFFDITGSPSSAFRGSGERRRLSYTTTQSSPLGISDFDATGSVNTPTKSNKASVGLNNKWLYEKSRSSPRGSPRSGIQAFL